MRVLLVTVLRVFRMAGVCAIRLSELHSTAALSLLLTLFSLTDTRGRSHRIRLDGDVQGARGRERREEEGGRVNSWRRGPLRASTPRPPTLPYFSGRIFFLPLSPPAIDT